MVATRSPLSVIVLAGCADCPVDPASDRCAHALAVTHASPQTIEDLIAAGHPAVKWFVVRERLQSLVAALPNDPLTPNALGAWDRCKTPKDHYGGGEQQGACMIVRHNLYRIYRETGDEQYWASALKAYNYASSQLDRVQMKATREYLLKHNQPRLRAERSTSWRDARRPGLRVPHLRTPQPIRSSRTDWT